MTGTPAQRLALLRTPCDGLCAPDPLDQRWVTAFLQRGNQAQILNPAANHPPIISMTANAWSWPKFTATGATATKRIWPSPAMWWSPDTYSTVWPGGPNQIRSYANVPMDAAWQRPAGTDGGMLVEGPTAGHGWELLNSRVGTAWDVFLINLALWQAGSPVSANNGDLIADVIVKRTPANVGTYNGRGAGKLPKNDVLTFAELDGGPNVRASALPFVSANPRWRQTGGPVLVEGIGFVDPATRVEHDGVATYPIPSTPNPPGNHLWSTPHGWRWRLDPRIWTDSVISARATSWNAGNPGRIHAATNLMKILRYWGAYQAETGGGEPQLETSNAPTASDRAAWTAMLGADNTVRALVQPMLVTVAGRVPLVAVGRVPI